MLSIWARQYLKLIFDNKSRHLKAQEQKTKHKLKPENQTNVKPFTYWEAVFSGRPPPAEILTCQKQRPKLPMTDCKCERSGLAM